MLAGGLDDDVHAQRRPIRVTGFGVGEDGDPSALGHEVTVREGRPAGVAPEDGVVLEQVGEGHRVGDVDDGRHLDVAAVTHLAEHVAPDPAETHQPDASGGLLGRCHERRARGTPRVPIRVGNHVRRRDGYPRLVRITILTLFPEFFPGPLGAGIVGRALADGRVAVGAVDLRDFGIGAYRQVDDAPFGGGPGMVMMIEPLARALERLGGTHRVLLTPAGTPLTQDTLDRWAGLAALTLVCGRYEGIAERVAEHLIDEEVSLGDFVLAGGEAAALAIVEGVIRLLPGVVNNPVSTESESFRGDV